MTYLGWPLAVIGLVLYLAAFAQGPGPTMGDRPLQASLFTAATACFVAALVFLVVI